MVITVYKSFLLYFWLLFQFAELQETFVFAFSTSKCNHYEIENSLKATLNCIMWCLDDNVEDEMLQINTTQYLRSNESSTGPISSRQKIIDDLHCCIHINLEPCFEEKVLNELSFHTFHNFMNRTKQPQIICNEQTNVKENQLKISTSVSSSSRQDNIPGFVLGIITSDKNCSQEDFVKSINSSSNCLQKDVIPETQKLLSSIIGFAFDHVYSKSVSCRAIVDGLNTCFEKEKCLSMQEINLIKNSFATFYKVAMSYVTKTFEKFRGNSFNRFKQNYVDDENKNRRNKSQFHQTGFEKKVSSINFTIKSFEVR